LLQIHADCRWWEWAICVYLRKSAARCFGSGFLRVPVSPLLRGRYLLWRIVAFLVLFCSWPLATGRKTFFPPCPPCLGVSVVGVGLRANTRSSQNPVAAG